MGISVTIITQSFVSRWKGASEYAILRAAEGVRSSE